MTRRRVVRLWVRMHKGLITSMCAAAGAALIGVGSATQDYVQSVLLEVGAGFLLFGPLFWLEQAFEETLIGAEDRQAEAASSEAAAVVRPRVGDAARRALEYEQAIEDALRRLGVEVSAALDHGYDFLAVRGARAVAIEVKALSGLVSRQTVLQAVGLAASTGHRLLMVSATPFTRAAEEEIARLRGGVMGVVWRGPGDDGPLAAALTAALADAP